jgi:hypothetical protein
MTVVETKISPVAGLSQICRRACLLAGVTSVVVVEVFSPPLKYCVMNPKRAGVGSGPRAFFVVAKVSAVFGVVKKKYQIRTPTENKETITIKKNKRRLIILSIAGG